MMENWWAVISDGIILFEFVDGRVRTDWNPRIRVERRRLGRWSSAFCDGSADGVRNKGINAGIGITNEEMRFYSVIASRRPFLPGAGTGPSRVRVGLRPWPKSGRRIQAEWARVCNSDRICTKIIEARREVGLILNLRFAIFWRKKPNLSRIHMPYPIFPCPWCLVRCA